MWAIVKMDILVHAMVSVKDVLKDPHVEVLVPSWCCY